MERFFLMDSRLLPIQILLCVIGAVNTVLTITI